jgi:hypothetical protein
MPDLNDIFDRYDKRIAECVRTIVFLESELEFTRKQLEKYEPKDSVSEEAIKPSGSAQSKE